MLVVPASSKPKAIDLLWKRSPPNAILSGLDYLLPVSIGFRDVLVIDIK